jgi:YggT family protein
MFVSWFLAFALLFSHAEAFLTAPQKLIMRISKINLAMEIQSHEARHSFDATNYLLQSSLLCSPSIAFAGDLTNRSIVPLAIPSLDLFINLLNVLFLARTIISWYPKTNKQTFPFNGIFWLTEPLLVPARQLVPPAFGVDISPIVWIMVLSFLREILLGQQGILTLMERN